MIEQIVWHIAIVAITIVAYALLCNRLMRATQRVRIKAAELATEVILDSRTPKHVAMKMQTMQGDLLNSSAPWLIAIMLIPYALQFGFRRTEEYPVTDYDDLNSKINQASTYSIISFLALSPIATTIICLQGLLILAYLASLKKFSNFVKRVLGHSISSNHRHA
jgi:hypothetical protein